MVRYNALESRRLLHNADQFTGSPNRLREVVQVLTHGTMELLNRKRGEDQRPQPAPRGTAGPLYPPFTAGPPGFVPPTTSATKIPPSSHISTEPYPAIYNHDIQRSSLPIFSDGSTIGSLPEGQGFDPVTLGPNPTGIYTFPQSLPPATEPQPASVFGWWSGNESWREYMQSISTMAGELDPTETYSASALIALNRDCDSSILRPDPNSHNGTPNAANIGLNAVNTTGSPGATISPSRNPYPAQETTGAWPIMTGNYGYADNSALRGVGDTGNNGP